MCRRLSIEGKHTPATFLQLFMIHYELEVYKPPKSPTPPWTMESSTIPGSVPLRAPSLRLRGGGQGTYTHVSYFGESITPQDGIPYIRVTVCDVDVTLLTR